MKPSDFNFFSDLVYRVSGNLLEHYSPLSIENRLRLFASQNGHGTVDELIHKLRLSRDPALEYESVSAALNDETHFFRDARTFGLLRDDILPKVLEAAGGKRQVVIRSAACASGQELYSIAMLLREHFPDVEPSSVSLYGSDISPKRIARAEIGTYSLHEVNRGLPAKLLVSHFEQLADGWRIKKELRHWPRFNVDNVLDPKVDVGRVDLLLLRNVMIYFDDETRARVLQHAAARIASGGYLVLGACETVASGYEHFEPLTLGCYRRK
jgi:chemotaxis protein methyltransferase CheR